MVASVKAEADELPIAEPAVAKSENVLMTESTPMTMVQRVQAILAVFDEVRPQLKADGGDITLIEVQEEKIFIKLDGACGDCQMASATLGWIQQRLVETLGEFVRLIPTNGASQTVSRRV